MYNKLDYIRAEITRIRQQIRLAERERRTLLAHDQPVEGVATVIRHLTVKLELQQHMLDARRAAVQRET